MGANIGTTLGNGLIALPLGPLGLLLGGFFALVHVFSKNDRVKNIALACMGFALIFYGLNLMTGGLRPLRNMPEVMAAISSLKADSLLGVIYCVLIAALITAMIHSSSATIGIVMGLGAAGVLGWQTAVAFSLGADLGTTITSWMASLNLSKNAKRAAYAHISFNIIGVLVMLPLFFPSMQLLTWAMGWFGGDPSVPVIRDGKETFPLVPVAVGLYSIGFNIFNTLLLFPFVGVFERVLSRIGHTSVRGCRRLLDAALPRSAQGRRAGDRRPAGAAGDGALCRGAPACFSRSRARRSRRRATPRIIRRRSTSSAATSAGTRRRCSSPTCRTREADLLASLIEEEDFTASLGETLFQVARRVERQPFSPRRPRAGRCDARPDRAGDAHDRPWAGCRAGAGPNADERQQFLLSTRERCLQLGADLPWEERGAILELLGSAERAFFLIDRIDAERRSVPRVGGRSGAKPRAPGHRPALGLGRPLIAAERSRERTTS